MCFCIIIIIGYITILKYKTNFISLLIIIIDLCNTWPKTVYRLTVTKLFINSNLYIVILLKTVTKPLTVFYE